MNSRATPPKKEGKMRIRAFPVSIFSRFRKQIFAKQGIHSKFLSKKQSVFLKIAFCYTTLLLHSMSKILHSSQNRIDGVSN